MKKKPGTVNGLAEKYFDVSTKVRSRVLKTSVASVYKTNLRVTHISTE